MAAFYNQKWFKTALPYAAGALAAAGAVAAVGSSQGWFDGSTTGAAPTMGAETGGAWPSGEALPLPPPDPSSYGYTADADGVLSGSGIASAGGGSAGSGLFSSDSMLGRAGNYVASNPGMLLGAGLAALPLLSQEDEQPTQADQIAAMNASRTADMERWNAIPYTPYDREQRYKRPGVGVRPNTGQQRARGGERRYFAEGGAIDQAQRHENGYLSGPGDGMSDSIGAMAHGEEGSRDVDVADGEYVIAADVVSGLGNGSTDAGVRFLDDLQARVRGARTGGQQPEMINPRQMLGG